MAELWPETVAARLAVLRALYIREPLALAITRLEHERPQVADPFAVRAARALAELRALCELAVELQTLRPSP